MPRFITFNVPPRGRKTVVEAHQFDGSWFNGRYLTDWSLGRTVWNDDFTLSVPTPGGERVAKKFDWVTRNAALELGVVERFAFEANYKADD